jgi:glycosyltransferase involved in cell wall biosynthesis
MTPRDAPRTDVTSVYICCWSLRDPLCQTQTLAYLRGLTAEGHRFALVTFEYAQYAMSRQERAVAAAELEAIGIYWYPVPYQRLPPLLRKTIVVANTVALGAYATLRHRARIMHARSAAPAAIAILLSRLFRLSFLYDSDTEVSQELVDIARWQRESPRHKLLVRCERLARDLSDSTIVLTDYMRERFREEAQGSAPVTVIPCCVDADRFRFDATKRELRRRELGLTDERQRLFVYVGKIGGWYLVDETFELFKVARERVGPSRLLVLSPDPPQAFRAIAERHGVPPEAYEVRSAPHHEVVEWLSAADVGLALIAPFESKRGCSPVKVGEYLAVGLPVVITRNIGDYSRWIHDERLGAVLAAETRPAYERAADELVALWQEGDVLRERCRSAAEAHVSLAGVGVPRYRKVYDQLTRTESAPARQGAGAT